MSQAQFSLCWDAHKKNICSGLSSLQQNAEFVDMTLAADGHLVKVHQIVIALASPYLKELIASAQCPHPIVFLNKISYATLSAVLEYIYTGEVLVSIENLSELIEAGKELHIRGLKDMKLQEVSSRVHRETEPKRVLCNSQEEPMEDEICYLDLSENAAQNANVLKVENVSTENIEENLEQSTFEEMMPVHDNEVDLPDSENWKANAEIVTLKPAEEKHMTDSNRINEAMSSLQYTVSNQGSLQLILNRYVYYLKHSNRDGSRHWRCVDYLSHSRCPAIAVTQDEVVIQRTAAHTHQFHDKKVLKKLREGAIFSALQDAELEGENKKNNRPRDFSVCSE